MLEDVALGMMGFSLSDALHGHKLGQDVLQEPEFIHQPQRPHAPGIDEHEAVEKFGFLLEALRFGAPPHGGLALGLDRVAMILIGGASLRDVIAFPKTQRATCPLTDAPTPVDEKQLQELDIRLIAPPK